MKPFNQWPRDIVSVVWYWCNLYDLVRLSGTCHGTRNALTRLEKNWWERYFTVEDEGNVTFLRHFVKRWDICNTLWLGNVLMTNVPALDTPYPLFKVLCNLNDSAIVRRFLDRYTDAEFVYYRLLQTQSLNTLSHYKGDKEELSRVSVMSQVSDEAFWFFKIQNNLPFGTVYATFTRPEERKYYFSRLSLFDVVESWRALCIPVVASVWIVQCEQIVRRWDQCGTAAAVIALHMVGVVRSLPLVRCREMGKRAKALFEGTQLHAELFDVGCKRSRLEDFRYPERIVCFLMALDFPGGMEKLRNAYRAWNNDAVKCILAGHPIQ